MDLRDRLAILSGVRAEKVRKEMESAATGRTNDPTVVAVVDGAPRVVRCECP